MRKTFFVASNWTVIELPIVTGKKALLVWTDLIFKVFNLENYYVAVINRCMNAGD